MGQDDRRHQALPVEQPGPQVARRARRSGRQILYAPERLRHACALPNSAEGSALWYDFLRNHGLLAVGASSTLPPVAGLHLRIMEGISSCGTPSDCYHIIDPAWGGQKYPERTFDFETKYNLAMSFGGGAHWQVAHYF